MLCGSLVMPLYISVGNHNSFFKRCTAQALKILPSSQTKYCEDALLKQKNMPLRQRAPSFLGFCLWTLICNL